MTTPAYRIGTEIVCSDCLAKHSEYQGKPRHLATLERYGEYTEQRVYLGIGDNGADRIGRTMALECTVCSRVCAEEVDQ